jgi:hypothetical protein
VGVGDRGSLRVGPAGAVLALDSAATSTGRAEQVQVEQDQVERPGGKMPGPQGSPSSASMTSNPSPQCAIRPLGGVHLDQQEPPRSFPSMAAPSAEAAGFLRPLPVSCRSIRTGGRGRNRCHSEIPGRISPRTGRVSYRDRQVVPTRIRRSLDRRPLHLDKGECGRVTVTGSGLPAAAG